MTEEKAKEILDFLAKRINFDEFVVCPALKNKCSFATYYRSFASDYLGACKHFNSPVRFMLYFDETIRNLIYMSSPSFVEVLEKLLKFSRCMKEDIYCGSSERIFLGHDTSLEEILIEMDLNRYE